MRQAPNQFLGNNYSPLARQPNVYEVGGSLGTVRYEGAMKLSLVTVLPTAEESRRGERQIVTGGPGVADRVYECRKNAADAYIWVEV